ncbi:hypothetical protein [Nocardia paucivorans]|uniref:hypothetical protein n=1 Tax=Nocardia paucivorans TaxID=114259 RepID=UPI0002E65558|nr:hypothetical protein [Nocardia paucivorans]
MTNDYDDFDPDFDVDVDAEATPATEPAPKIYEVFNPDHTVGVACDRDGEIVGLHITDEARDNGDAWLGSEIVKVAKLAHMKSRLGLRKEMEEKGNRPYTIDAFGLPTEASYRAMEDAEFGSRAI